LAQNQTGVQNLAAPVQTGLGEFSAHFDGILGTSLDMVLHTLEPATARHCQERIFAEIERLCGILSTYDPASEIHQIMAGAPVRSPELAEVLDAYAAWAGRTGGAINVNLGAVIATWKAAEKSGVMPAESALRAALATPRALNVDALGKGYIIDRAVSLARCLVPAGLLNIGGDIRVWGEVNWLIGIANPAQPADNAVPVATYTLRDAAVATSGGYARYFTLKGQRLSHLLSPLTLRPLPPLTAATVVARDCVTANALASAACVLGATEGGVLAKTYGVAHFIWDALARRVVTENILVAADTSSLNAGHEALASVSGAAESIPPPSSPTTAPGTATTAAALAAGTAPAAPQNPWPKNYQVSITLNLGTPQTARGKHPYVAVWILNEKNALVRTVDVWGRQPKYVLELTDWWKLAGNLRSPAFMVTRATRPDGKYTLVWDGKDDKGVALPQGKYMVVLEINREHASHAKQTVVLNCTAQPAAGVLKATSESGDSPVKYGPPDAPATGAPPAAAIPVMTPHIIAPTAQPAGHT
jgi:thiamine biosynthesis lipoprotein ApbE